MNPTATSAIILACLFGAVWLGTVVRRFIPQHHVSENTRDTIKLAMGLVATMAALLLGLLVSSAKNSYDTVRGEVIQLGAKIAFFDRVLGLYGPEAAPLRVALRPAVDDAVEALWSEGGIARSRESSANDGLFAVIQGLVPADDKQHTLKDQASSLAVEIAQLRTLMHAQSLASISLPLVVVVVVWLVIIFLGFTIIAPPNATATLSLLVSALAVAGAIFLILEMDHPFTGLIRISSAPLTNALPPSETPNR